MEYFKLFRLEKEPFSNTPDPDFFYRSNRHTECLQKIELAVRLRRGLCIVRGEVGTGKTTLCRQLIRIMSEDKAMEVHLVLDPGFDRTELFAAAVNEMLNGPSKARFCSCINEHREMIKNRLFEAGVELEKTIVLIIDEGQKLSAGCMEFLRELLNYETNSHKLLQIVIFAQNEIRQLLLKCPNFSDRAALYHHLRPLDRKETARLISHRLQMAGGSVQKASGPAFTRSAMVRIHRLTRGYPRKIIHLGHNILLLLLIKGTGKVTPAIVDQAASSLPFAEKIRIPRVSARTAGLIAATIATVSVFVAASAGWPVFSEAEKETQVEAAGTARPDAAVNTESPPETEVLPAVEIPEYLGRVRISDNDMLFNMLARIYGSRSPDTMKKVLESNPGIENPDRIRAGHEINFPVLASLPVPEDQRYWIAWEKSGDLDRAYRFVFFNRPHDLRVLSFWMPDSGIGHAAVFGRCFAEYREAAGAAALLAEDIPGQPIVLDLGEDGALLVNGF